uniref:RING-type domain-containing protein n=1 Tax=Magallana gigas TaxID=29159 RepID=A0A8W8JKU2_MAGGI
MFRKQTEYVTDGEIQNTNSEGDTVGTGRHSPPLDPNYRSDSNRALTTENTDVEQGQEGNTGHISSPFPSRDRNSTPTSDNNFQYSERILNAGLTLEENSGVRNSPLEVPTDSLTNGDILQTHNSGENEDFLEEMQSPMVQNILETGVDLNIVMQKLKTRARERGDNYQNADDLLNSVLSMDRSSDSVNTHAMQTIPSLPLRNQHTSNTGYNNLDIVAQHLDEERGSVDVNPELNSHHLHSLTVSDHQIDARTVRDLMESPIVQTVLGTGVDRNSVMQAIEKRLRETGDTYSNAEELMDMILTLQQNVGLLEQDNHENIVQMQQPMLEAVMDMGVDWNSVMQVIERRLMETGENYRDVEDLLNAVLVLEQNPRTHNIPPNPDYEDDYLAALALEENQGSDFILPDTTPSTHSDPYTSSDSLSANHRVNPEILRADMQQPIVEAVLETGVDRNIVKTAIERRIRETGGNFPNVQELMDAVLILESNIRSYNVPQSTPRLRVPLEATPGNVSFRSQATKLAEENRQLRQQRVCKICLDADIGVVFLPCGHLCCCQTCASEVPHCPVCRANINSRVSVFIS